MNAPLLTSVSADVASEQEVQNNEQQTFTDLNVAEENPRLISISAVPPIKTPIYKRK